MEFRDWLAGIQEEPATFTTTVAEGVEVTLRIPRSADELAKMEKAADRFAASATARPAPEWADLKPETTTAGRMAYLFQQLCQDPPDLSIRDVLTLLRHKGLMVIALVTEAYRRAGALIVEQEVSDIERAGESSEATTSSAPNG